MKKKAISAALITLFAAALSITSYAYYTKTKSIPSVRITVSTGDLEIGDDLSDNADAYVAVSDSNQYYEIDDAEWLDEVEELKVGDSPRMQVTLSAIPKEVDNSRYSTIYLFSGSYSSGNVSIKNGDLIAADVRDSGYTLLVTLRIDAVKGTYSDPVSASWTSTLGTAKWDADTNDSGYYDVYCYRGSKTVKRLISYHGNTYNFYPYMTEAGDYTFKVRTVPTPGTSGGKSSDWTESSVLSISKTEVSDGTGQTTSDENGGSGSTVSGGIVTYINGQDFGNQYGWITSGSDKYFRYPDGSIANGWLNLDGTYYRFDSSGKMLTGWFKNQYGIWFYLEPGTGAMKTGWFNDNGNYYYLRTDKNDYEGSMVTGWADIGGKRYYFNDSGMMVTGWRAIDGKYYYFYPQGSTGGAYGYLATSTKIGEFYVGADGAWIH